jgi:hypothetical protein
VQRPQAAVRADGLAQMFGRTPQTRRNSLPPGDFGATGALGTLASPPNQAHRRCIMYRRDPAGPFITADGPVREVRFRRNADGSRDGGVHNLFVISGRRDAGHCAIAQPDFRAAVAAAARPELVAPWHLSKHTPGYHVSTRPRSTAAERWAAPVGTAFIPGALSFQRQPSEDATLAQHPDVIADLRIPLLHERRMHVTTLESRVAPEASPRYRRCDAGAASACICKPSSRATPPASQKRHREDEMCQCRLLQRCVSSGPCCVPLATE